MANLTSAFSLPTTEPNDVLSDAFATAEIEGVLAGNADPTGKIEPHVLAELQVKQEAKEKLQSTGMLVSDLATKASEGMSKMVSDFGDALSFGKAGALAPSFSSVMASVQTSAMNAIGGAVSGAVGGAIDSVKSAVGGVIGKAFGGAKGLAPPDALGKLIASKDPKNGAAIAKAANKGVSDAADKSYLVTLTSMVDGNKVVFDVMPEVVENRTANYEAIAPVQFPGAFQKYKGTDSTTWTINAMFISRTSREASINLMRINRLRSWTLPYYGERTREIWPDRIGAPPPVLMLSGLRKSIVGPMPVVITSVSWTWPRDVDYIPATASNGSADNIPFPTVISVAINLVEALSTKEFNNFNLNDFMLGNMIDSFRAPAGAEPKNKDEPAPPEPVAEPATTTQPGLVSVAGTYGSNLKELTFNVLNSGKQEAQAVVNGIKSFKSGGGGDFGGGGATGTW